MEKKRLLETLDALRADLAHDDQVDPKMLSELRRLTDDLRQSVGSGASSSEAAVEEPAHGLRDLLLRFEAEHPQLSVAAGRVADALAAMGF
ncbi:MAG TPA: DUF4404 family protein [Lacipirellulaceae bacterium]|nr:DUF4404 family protein [Lacipirellulaceae bacterium]